MNKELQYTIDKFILAAKMIDGAEYAIFELSDEIGNCLILTGEILGENTHDKINELGRKYGLLILARNLSVKYDNLGN
jgi:hypothetical protein